MWTINTVENLNPEHRNIYYTLSDKAKQKTLEINVLTPWVDNENNGSWLYVSWNKEFIDNQNNSYSLRTELIGALDDTDKLRYREIQSANDLFNWTDLGITRISWFSDILFCELKPPQNAGPFQRLLNFDMNAYQFKLGENAATNMPAFLSENNKTYKDFLSDVINNTNFTIALKEDLQTCLDLINKNLVQRLIYVT